MTTTQIDCFLAVTQLGSISAAAKSLYLSPQVVSQHISALEKELTVTLFHRSKAGMDLTEHGRDLYDYSIRWKGLYNHTIQSIAELYNNLSLRFRVGISEYIDVLGAISGSISTFAQNHGSTRMRCVQQSNHVLFNSILAGDLDVAIMCETQVTPNADLEVVPVAKEDLRLYVSGVDDINPNLTLDSPELLDIFQSLPHVNTPYGHWNNLGWQEISRRMNTFLGVPAQTHYSVPNFRSVLACVHTIPCTIVCDARFGFTRETDGIFNIPLNISSDICCVWSKQNENPLIRDFVNHIRRYYDPDQKFYKEAP